MKVTISLDNLCKLRDKARDSDTDREYISELQDMLSYSRDALAAERGRIAVLQGALDKAQRTPTDSLGEQGELLRKLGLAIRDAQFARREMYAQRYVPAGQSYIILHDFGSNKINIIKVVREMTDMGLKEAKEVVEAPPVKLPWHGSEAEAEQYKQKLVDAGADVVTCHRAFELIGFVSDRDWGVVLAGLPLAVYYKVEVK